MNTLPFFNCSTTIAWIDDDSLFTTAGTSFLKNQYDFKVFNHPQIALDYFEQYTPILPSLHFFRGCEEHETYDGVRNMPIELNIDTLSKIRTQQLIKQDISAIIVDYNMPGMTGVELCRKLKSLPMKKILLTGESGNANVIAAFNEGIIDRFIKKEAPTLTEEISHYLKTLTQEYLSQNTKGLLSYIKIKQITPLIDSTFIDFFNQWCHENHIKEYYLSDNEGTFIIVDKYNKSSYFVTHTDNSLDQFVEINNDDEDVSEFIHAVSHRKLIPFFGIGKEAWQFEPKEWHNHFFIPHVIKGNNTYYWTTISA